LHLETGAVTKLLDNFRSCTEEKTEVFSKEEKKRHICFTIADVSFTKARNFIET
jgi:hypothetical protein